jgi:hypothetical protein
MNEEPTAMSAALLAAQARRSQRLTLRDPAPAKPAAPTTKATELPKPPPPRVEAPPPEPEPAHRPECRRLSFVDEFARLAQLVPPGTWPKTLPTAFTPPHEIRPVALGIGKRVEALLPKEEHKALHLALRLFTGSTPYLVALAADEAVRWSDDGETVVEPVSEEHRQTAGAALLLRAARRKEGA